MLYLSAHSLYPGPDYHSWRASSADHEPVALLETDEWPLSSKMCYWSLSAVEDAISVSAPELLAKPASGQWLVCSTVESEGGELADADAARLAAFEAIFQDIDGSFASQHDRAGPDAQSDPSGDPAAAHALTYGEVTYFGMQSLLHACGWGEGECKTGGVFYDLGCGSGKAVVAAALTRTPAFDRCVGVELLPSLAACAQTAATRAASMMRSDLLLQSTPPGSPLPELVILQQDLANCIVDDADLVFVSASCFSDALLAAILRNAAGMKRGAVFATSRLPPNFQVAGWDLERTCWVKMSWAKVQLHILRRL